MKFKSLCMVTLLLGSLACQRNFDMENYYAWCIVPFDKMERTPEQRIEMLNDLGFTKYAYDWREKHLVDLPHEIKLSRQNNIDMMAVWIWIDDRYDTVGKLNASNEKIFSIVQQSELKTQFWLGFHNNYFEGLSHAESVNKGAAMVDYLNKRAEKIGCKVALYNHGGWFGDPRNQIEIIDKLSSNHVGIIYNFHHAHKQLDEFPQIINKALPHLWAVNLNGMREEGPKILPLGQGNREGEMLSILKNAGYNGPFGILCHVETEDAKVVLENNLDGLKNLMNKN